MHAEGRDRSETLRQAERKGKNRPGARCAFGGPTCPLPTRWAINQSQRQTLHSQLINSLHNGAGRSSSDTPTTPRHHRESILDFHSKLFLLNRLPHRLYLSRPAPLAHPTRLQIHFPHGTHGGHTASPNQHSLAGHGLALHGLQAMRLARASCAKCAGSTPRNGRESRVKLRDRRGVTLSHPACVDKEANLKFCARKKRAPRKPRRRCSTRCLVPKSS